MMSFRKLLHFLDALLGAQLAPQDNSPMSKRRSQLRQDGQNEIEQPDQPAWAIPSRLQLR
jgi:hypothetical protein